MVMNLYNEEDKEKETIVPKETTLDESERIFISPLESTQIDNMLSNSSDPKSDSSKYACALKFSRQLHIPFEKAVANIDYLMENNTNLIKPITYDLTAVQAVSNSFKLGKYSTNDNFLCTQLMNMERDGEDASELESRIWDNKKRIAALQDNVPRGYVTDVAKAVAFNTTFNMSTSVPTFIVGGLSAITPYFPGKNTIATVASSVAAGAITYENLEGAMYWELTRERGMDKDAARTYAKANSAVNSAIEVALDSTLGLFAGIITGGQLKSAVNQTAMKMFKKGKMGGLGVGISTITKSWLSEGLEEFLQCYVDEFTYYFADELMGVGVNKEIKDVFVDNFQKACKEGMMGVAVAAVMGVPFDVASLNMSVKQARDVKTVIQNSPTIDDAVKLSSAITGLNEEEISPIVEKAWYKVQDNKAKSISAENLIKSDTEAIKLTRQTRTEALQDVAEDKVGKVSTKHENAVRKAVDERLPVSDKVLEEYAGKDWADKEIKYRQEYPAVKEFYDANEDIIANSKDFKDFKNKVENPEIFAGDADYMEWAYDKKKNELMVGTSKQQFISDYTTSHEKILKLKEEIRKYKQENDNGKIEEYTGDWDNVDNRLFELEKESSDEEFEAVRQDIVKNPQGYIDALSLSQDQRLAETGQSTYKSQFMRSESKYDKDIDTEENAEIEESLDDYFTNEELEDSIAFNDAEEEVLSIETEIAEFSDDEKMMITSDDMSDEELAELAPSLLAMRDKYSTAKAKKDKYKKKYEAAMEKAKLNATKVKILMNGYKGLMADLSKAENKVKKLEAENKQLTDEYKQAKKDLRHIRAEFNKAAKSIIKNRTAKIIKFNDKVHDIGMAPMLDSFHDYILGRKVELDPNFRNYFSGLYLLTETPYSKLSLENKKLIYHIATIMNKQAREQYQENHQNKMKPRYEMSKKYAMQMLAIELEANKSLGIAIREKLDEMVFDEKNDGIVRKIQNSIGKPKRLARLIDGDREGVMYDIIWKALHDCDAEFYANYEKRVKSALDKHDELKIDDKKLKNTFIVYDKLTGKELTEEELKSDSKKKVTTLTLEQAMTAYIYSKSPEFKRNIMNKSGNHIGEKLLNKITDTLPANYKAYADYMLETVAERYKEISEHYEKQTNKKFVLRKGYFPAFAKNPVQQQRIDILAIQDFEPNAVSNTFTKEVTGKIYEMDLNGISNYFKSINKQERYLAYDSWVKDMNYYLSSNSGIGDIIKEIYGTDTYNTLWNFAKDVANPTKKLEAADKLMNTLLNNYSKAVLSGNILTMLKQIPSIATYFRGDIGASFIISENVRFFTNMKEVTDFVKSKSPIMAHRINSGYNFETSQFETNTNPLQVKAIDKVTNAMMKPISYVDLGVTIPMWKAAYEYEISKGTDEVHAIRIADAIIEDTQPTSGTRNLSKSQRDTTPYKRMLTMFSNQIMNSQNELFFDVPYYFKNKNYKKVAQIIASKLIAGAFMVAISSGVSNLGEDDEEKKKKNFSNEVLKQIPLLLIPGWVGPQMSSAMGGFGSNSSLSILSTSSSLLKQLAKPNEGDKWQKVGKSSVDLAIDALQVFGAPVVAGQRTIDTLKAILSEEEFKKVIAELM